MKKHTNKNLRRGLALFMTVLMMLSCFTAGFSVISFAADDATMTALINSNYPSYSANSANTGLATGDGSVNTFTAHAFHQGADTYGAFQSSLPDSQHKLPVLKVSHPTCSSSMKPS